MRYVLLLFAGLLAATPAFALNIDFYTTVAQQAFDSGEYDTAIAKCNKVLDADPSNATCKSLDEKIAARRKKAAQAEATANKERLFHLINKKIAEGDASDLDELYQEATQRYPNAPELSGLKSKIQTAKAKAKEEDAISGICGHERTIAAFDKHIAHEEEIDARAGTKGDSLDGVRRTKAVLEIEEDDLKAKYKDAHGHDFDMSQCKSFRAED